MEDAGQSVEAPGIAVAAFVLGLSPFVTCLLLYISSTIESCAAGETLSGIFVNLLIRVMPFLVPAAIICGAIGLYRSKRLPRTSRKGVAFSLIGLIQGVFTVIIIAVVLTVFFFTAKI